MRFAVVMLIQILCIVVVATGLALAWNSVSDQGLTLTKNNFRGGVQPVSGSAGDGDVSRTPVKPGTRVENGEPGNGESQNGGTGNGEAGNGEAPKVENGGTEPPKPPAHGLQTLTIDDVSVYVELAAEDPSVVILDARNVDNFREGHLPHALHLDHFRSDQMIEGLRGRLDSAQTIIVYCGGGDCQDSINLASTLITDFGYDYNLIFVYEGGLEEWKKTGYEVVIGE